MISNFDWENEWIRWLSALIGLSIHGILDD